MSRSSPAKRTQLLSSPDRNIKNTFLLDDRNNELSHRDALAAAQLEHDRVRQAAIRVFELHELKREHQRIVELERKEEERLKAEALVVSEEKRLRELKAKTVPKPPPAPKSPTPPPAKQVTPTRVNGAAQAQKSDPSVPSTTPPSEVKKPAPVPSHPLPNKPPQINPFATTAPAQPSTLSNSFQKPNGVAAQSTTATSAVPAAPAAPAAPTAPAAPAAPTAPAASPAVVAPAAAPAPQQTRTQTVDRYTHIHQGLKKLRKDLQAQSKVPGSPLKGKMGTFRREIRVSIGQLTSGKGANAQPISKINAALKEALEGKVPSPPIDVSHFVVDKREPVEGATNNDATMPSLFIYLINICAKGIVNQFINEAGANTKAADPVGVFTAQIFSQKDFQWRGKSLIDILMAKYRIACPVLFGHRGNDRTERGRIALGWKKDGGSWITEQNHNDRMTGLGAGFASLALRDFSKTTKTNPYPPTNYWKALASIVNSPANETSNTQYVVLRSMIEGHEQRFLNFYGNAALAALRFALVEFPKKAPKDANAAGSLRALADILQSEVGLVLV